MVRAGRVAPGRYLNELAQRIATIERVIPVWHLSQETRVPLAAIPGVGVRVTARVATIGAAMVFNEFASLMEVTYAVARLYWHRNC